jgi:hypothetical protein
MSEKKGEEILSAQLEKVSLSARKLFDVIVRQAYHGPLRPKVKGIATPTEILEACGLDVGEFYVLLDSLAEAGLIRVLTPYPFEEIHITPEAAEALLMAGLVTEKPGGSACWRRDPCRPALP